MSILIKLRTRRFAAILLGTFTLASCGGGSGSSTDSQSGASQAPDTNEPATLAAPIDRLVPTLIPDDIEPDIELNVSFANAQTNTLTDEQIAQMPPVTVADIAAAYELVLDANPELSTQSNDFALLIIEQLKLNQTQQRIAPITAKETILLLANPAERQLLLKNPDFIVPTAKATARAMGRTSLEIYGLADIPWKDRADAFRHSYWNWLLSDCCSIAWAEAFTNAHETTIINDDDRRMDLHNNGVGRKVYSWNPAGSAAEARATIMGLDVRFVNEKLTNVEVDSSSSRLGYLRPFQTFTLFDDGPSFDDVYGIKFNGNPSDSTPVGGSTTYEFISIDSGINRIEITCEQDSTEKGCGFKYKISGALYDSTGSKDTEQIIIEQGETYTDFFTFPLLNEVFIE